MVQARSGGRLSTIAFPATYLLHVAEEYWGGFPVWLSRVAGADLSREEFLVINAIALSVMTILVFVVSFRPRARFILAALATSVTVNALLHIGATILTHSYSPGVVTGTLLWLPLGIWTLQRLAHEIAGRQLALGIVIGLLLHAAVSWLALVS